MRVLVAMNGAANREERVVHARRLPALFEQIAARQVEVRLVLFGDAGGLRHDLLGAGIATTVVPAAVPPSVGAVASLPRAVMGLRRSIRAVGPHLVEGDEPMPAIIAGIASRGQRDHVITYRRHHHAGRRRLHAASRLAARLADRTIVSSETLRRQAAADDHTPLSQIEVARSGIADLRRVRSDEVDELRRSLQLPTDAAVIGVVSRLRWEKGIDIAIAAMTHVRDSAHLVIAGAGPDEMRLRSSSAGSTRVHFVGHQDDVALWMALADVIVMPSRRETFGRTTVESMAAGRPLVACAVGGLVEAVDHGTTGLLVPSDEPRALADAVNRLLDDPAFAAALGAQARQRYEGHHTIEAMADSWVEAWRRSLDARGTPST